MRSAIRFGDMWNAEAASSRRMRRRSMTNGAPGAKISDADFANFKNPGSGTSDNLYTGEVSYNLSDAWLLTASYIRLADRVNSNRDASLYKAGTDYFLSKRTALYADVGYVKNNSLGTLGIQNSTPVGVTGKNQLGLMVGIRQFF